MRLEDEIKQKEFRNEHTKAIVNLIFTHNWLDVKLKAFMKPHDITLQQFNILRILRGQLPNASTINLLKDRMLDKMCDASRIVDRLELKKMVIRKPNKDDKRIVDIVITKQGLNLLTEIDNQLPEHEKIMETLTAEEVKQLNFLLDKLRG